MTLNNEDCSSEALAALLEQDDRYRVLRSVPRRSTSMPGGPPPDGNCLAIVDVETSGFDPSTDKLIELAIMLLFVDNEANVLGYFGPLSWLQDPGIPLDPNITAITGLSNADLAGQTINDAMAFQLLERAECYIAHNARFNSAWIERRYPPISARAWACSCTEVPWKTLGFDGRAQSHLLVQHNLFANAHRAGDDVWSLFNLLQQSRLDPGGTVERTHLQRLLAASALNSVRVEAVHAPYGAKDRLKARNYSWNPRRKIWTKEMAFADLAAERSWYRQNELPPFRTETVTACERHR